MRGQSAVFLGRQPVVDRAGNVVAFELLFRSSPECGCACFSDDRLATAGVVTRAFRQVGIRAVVGDARALVNVCAETLMNRMIETLPPEQIVIELLEGVHIEDRLVRRCRTLKARGYRFALDDFCHYREIYDPLLEIVDVVKIDILGLGPAPLAALVAKLRSWPALLLAEKVESPERARECRELGFDLFQGFHFGRPVVLGRHPLGAGPERAQLAAARRATLRFSRAGRSERPMSRPQFPADRRFHLLGAAAGRRLCA